MNRGHIEGSSDDSMHVAANANVNVNKFSLPKDARDLIITTVMAFSIMVSIALFGLYQSTERKLEKSYEDIQTQVWLKQDKEEEKFQKFVAGPYAQLAGELRANEILFSKCKEIRP